MKFFTTLFMIGLFAISIHAQNSTFNNAGGDNLWSNAANWTDGLPTGIAFLRADVNVDSDQTIERIETPGPQSEDVTISGAGNLTLTGGNSNNGNAIRNQSNTGVNINVESHVIVNNTGGASNFSTKDILNNTITFGSTSLLTIMSQIKVKNFGVPNTATHFDGAIDGSGTITCINANSNITFGATADNTAFEGTMTVFITDVVSNSTVPGGFLSAPSTLACNADGGSLELNGENAMEGNINRNGQNPFTIDVNANQANVGYVKLQEGVLTFDLDPSVTALHFAPSNEFVWDTLGTVNITNFQNGIIRFGESDTTLTNHQLSLIDIGGGTVELTPDGFLQTSSPNSAPIVSSNISDMVEQEGFGTTTIDLTNNFSDPDGDALTYMATSTDENVATVSIAGDILTITEVGGGITTITVTADDNTTGTATDDFTFTIEQANGAPIVSSNISDMVEQEGFGTSTIDLSNNFSDPDGDALTYMATSSDENVATVSIAGDILTITEVGVGVSTITVTADDNTSGTATEDFMFTIEEVNAAPIVSSNIDDMVEQEGFGTSTIDLANNFSDPDGDALTYMATSSDENVATVSIAGDILTITEVGVGVSTITVTADDNTSGTATEDFTFTIEEVNAIKELAPISGLSILPNLTRDGQLAISFDHTISKGQLIIYNAYGVLVQKRTIEMESNFNIEMTATAAGLYFVLVQDFEKGAASTVQIMRL